MSGMLILRDLSAPSLEIEGRGQHSPEDRFVNDRATD